MDPHAPPETHSETQTESESAPPSTEIEDLNLPADLLSEIDTILFGLASFLITRLWIYTYTNIERGTPDTFAKTRPHGTSIRY